MSLIKLLENDILDRFNTDEYRIGEKTEVGHSIDILRRFSNESNWSKDIVIKFINDSEKIDAASAYISKAVLGIEKYRELTEWRNV